MAIYHYSRSIGSRAAGMNAVFAAAYIRGEKFTCVRTDETKDFTAKNHTLYKETFLPDDAPDWVKDIDNKALSEELWNRIELVERRQRAQLYFHDKIALPVELSFGESHELVREFVKDVLAKDGVFCDVAIHWEEHNPHFHVLMPMRTLTNNGFSNKIQISNSDLSKKVKEVRENWANYANQHLQQKGLSVRIDHRSHADRGLELLPTEKIGKANHMTNSEHVEYKVARNQAIKAHNQQAIENDPSILIKKLSQEREVITSDDLANEVAKNFVSIRTKQAVDQESSKSKIINDVIEALKEEHGIFDERQIKQHIFSNYDIEANQFSALCEAVQNHEDLVYLGVGVDGRDTYVSHTQFEKEKSLIEITEQLSKRKSIDILQPQIAEVVSKYSLNKSQQASLYHLASNTSLALNVGYAGTGKTHMMAAANELWTRNGIKVVGVAVSGAAAGELETKAGIPSYTVAAFKRAITNGDLLLDKNTIVVMDEMGMTNLYDMHAILSEVEKAKASFRGIGDIEQTQPIGTGAPMRSMMDVAGYSTMTEIMRQKVEWMKDATVALETQKTAIGFEAYASRGHVHLSQSKDQAEQLTLSKWQYKLDMGSSVQDVVMIAHKNDTVDRLNGLARQALVNNQRLTDSLKLHNKKGEIELAVGERILFTKNSRELGVKNGNFATIVSLDNNNGFTAQLEDGTQVEVNTNQYKDFTYGYAATVHKLQGASADHAIVYVDSQGWDRHLFLVGASRHKESLEIVSDQETFASLDEMKTAVSRGGLKDTIYDYPVRFGIVRGHDGGNLANRAANTIAKAYSGIKDGWLYLTNYSAYALKKAEQLQISPEHQQMLEVREEARKVASFKDNLSLIADKVQEIKAVEHDEQSSDTNELWSQLYDLQLENANLAYEIKHSDVDLSIAVEANRIKPASMEKALHFHECHDRANRLYYAHAHGDTINSKEAAIIIDDLKSHQRHIRVLTSSDDYQQSNANYHQFIADLRYSALSHRYQTAYAVLGLESRASIKDAKDYVEALHTIEQAKRAGQPYEEIAPLLQQRNQLAYALNNQTEVLAHFGIDQGFVEQNAATHQKTVDIQRYMSMQDGLAKQHFAHTIKANGKDYHAAVTSLLDDGWKSINIDNWKYQRRVELSKHDKAFRASVTKVDRYLDYARASKNAWQTSFELTEKNPIKSAMMRKQAQLYAVKRDSTAKTLIDHLETTTGALAYRKLDYKRLHQQARIMSYLDSYQRTDKAPLQMRMAAHMIDNLKIYGNHLQGLGLLEQARAQADRYYYIKQYGEANLNQREMLQYLRKYQIVNVKVGQAWAEHQSKASDEALATASALTYQRNQIAHRIAKIAARPGMTLPPRYDINKFIKQAQSYITEKQVKDYLQGDAQFRRANANALINNKAAYRFIRNYNIAYDQLRDEVIEHKLETYKPSANARVIERFDVKGINAALKADPNSYSYIFGDVTDKKPKTTRYGDYTVSHSGKYKGMWWDKSKERYAEPLEAIKQIYGKEVNGLTHYEYGAMLAGIPLEKAKIREVIDTDLTDLKRLHAERQEIKEKVQQCENLWSKTVPLEGSIAEQYLKQHRAIMLTSNLQMRCLPVGAYSYTDEEGNTKTNKLPMLVVPGYDRFNRLRSLQRIYLDPKTANKASFMDNPKLSMGVISGTGGLIQKGDSGRVYIVEGSETGASIANADPKATVYASFGVHNIAKMGGLIEKGKYAEVVIAADNDGVGSNAEKLTLQAQAELAKKGIKATIITPKAIEGKSKTDWNDIHQTFTLQSVRRNMPYYKEVQEQNRLMHQFGQYIDKRAQAELGHGDEIVQAFYAKNKDKVEGLAKAHADLGITITAAELKQGKLDIKSLKLTEPATKTMMHLSKSIKQLVEIEKDVEKSKTLSKGRDYGIDI